MDYGKFNAIFPIISAHLVDRIQRGANITEDEAINLLYASSLYSALEDEETKVWQYSVEKLYDLFITERETGKLVLPEY